MHIDLGPLWQPIEAFFNSAFFAALFTAIAGSMAGAFWGAYGGQRIVERGKQREELLTEIRNTNATVMVAVGICNSFLGIKRQNVKPLKDLYDAQNAAYHAHAKKRELGQISLDTPFEFVANLQSLSLPPFPLEILRQQIFEKLSLSGRPLLLVNALGETIHGLNTSINARNVLIDDYKKSSFSAELYFGLPLGDSRVINQEYPASIEQIYRHTDNGIFFSHLLSADLFDHGKELAHRFKQLFGKDAPAFLNKPDFTDAAALMPKVEKYVDWVKLVKEAEQSTETVGRSRRSVFKLLSPSFLKWPKKRPRF